MFSVIVACDSKNGIGKNGTLPWHIPKDLRRFRAITNGCNVIMGRKTWESLPVKPLKNRHNIIISQTLDKQSIRDFKEVSICSDLQRAIDLCGNLSASGEFDYNPESIQTYVIGGSRLYNEAMRHPDCRDIIVTRVLGDFECDTFINKIPDDYICVFKTEVQTDNDNFSSSGGASDIQFRTEIWSKPQSEDGKIKSSI